MSCRCRISHIGQAADNAKLIGYFRLNVNSRRSCLFGMIIKTSSTYLIKMRRWGAATQMAAISHMILFRKVQFQTCKKSRPRNGKVQSGWMIFTVPYSVNGLGKYKFRCAVWSHYFWHSHADGKEAMLLMTSEWLKVYCTAGDYLFSIFKRTPYHVNGIHWRIYHITQYLSRTI